MPEGFPDLHQRFDYDWGTLDAADLGADPVAALLGWLAEAEGLGIEDYNAMALATVGPDGRPSMRNVLLRGIDDDGRLRFFTNRSSRKGTQIAANAAVSLLFSWLPMHRQVRVDGDATVLDDAASDEYFATRPRQSRIAAWASPQSQVIGSRAELDDAVAGHDAGFGDGEVPRPPFWGGYAVEPLEVEFWQGRPNRLHDRIRFRRSPGGGPWVVERLAP